MKRKVIKKIMIGACTIAIVGCLGGCSTSETKGKAKETVTEQTDTATTEDKGKAKETVKEQTDTATKGKAKETVTATKEANGNSSSDTAKNSNSSSTVTSANNTSKGSGSNKSTTTTKATHETPKTHEHKWQPVYTTVHHDAITHTEQQDQGHYETTTTRVYIEKYDNGEVYEFTSSDEASAHAEAYALQDIGGRSTFQDRTTKTWIPNIVTVTITDKEAYDEQVVSGYTCSCGATK